MKNKRVRYLDWAKGLGIIMVTYGHILPLSEGLNTWMGMFKLAIFYVVAGWLLALRPSALDINTASFAKKRLLSLGWPYLTFSLLSLCFRAWFRFLREKDPLVLMELDLRFTLTLRGISALWFLPSLFLAELAFFALQRTRFKPLIALGFVYPLVLAQYAKGFLGQFPEDTVAYCLVLAFSKGLVVSWFVQVGFYAQKLLSRLENNSVRAALGVLMMALTVVLVPYVPSYNLNGLSLGRNPLLFFFCGTVDSLGALLVFEALERHCDLPLLSYFGLNSLILMGTQRGMLLINVITGGVDSLGDLSETVEPFYYLETLTILFFTLLIASGAIELINRHFPYLVHFPRRRQASGTPCPPPAS